MDIDTNEPKQQNKNENTNKNITAREKGRVRTG
jgi:hypothetical protein